MYKDCTGVWLTIRPEMPINVCGLLSFAISSQFHWQCPVCLYTEKCALFLVQLQHTRWCLLFLFSQWRRRRRWRWPSIEAVARFYSQNKLMSRVFQRLDREFMTIKRYTFSLLYMQTVANWTGKKRIPAAKHWEKDGMMGLTAKSSQIIDEIT